MDNKKLKLLKSFIEQSSNKGYNNITICDITENAGIGKGTFYLYFKNKEDCLIQAINYITPTIKNLLLDDIKSNSEEEIYNIASKVYDTVWSNRATGRLYAYELQDKFKNILKDFTNKSKNMYKDIIKILKPKDTEESIEIKSLMIMGIIFALTFEVYSFTEDNNNQKEQFIKSFKAIINSNII